MIAVHFGAGNIGRGFIGQLLHESGYSLTFLDVNAELVNLLNEQGSYRIFETGPVAKTTEISGFNAINTNTEFDLAAAAIASADILTTSVGANALKFLVPVLVAGLNSRKNAKPLLIMACENAIRATDIFRAEIAAIDSSVLDKAVFANTAVDRIVPPQKDSQGLDVLVEEFCEWIIETSELGENIPNIPRAHFVSDLDPYIERKLFTVNTGHAALAYLGQQHGCKTIVDAINNPDVKNTVSRVLAETSQVLVRRHDLDEVAQANYVEKTLERFSEPQLDDPVTRVGREPSRKLSRNERLVAPAAYLADWGIEPTALLKAIGAALVFEDSSDPEVEELRGKLSRLPAEDFVSEVMGISDPHPLAAKLTGLVKQVKLKNYSL